MIKVGFHNFSTKNNFADRMIRKANRALAGLNVVHLTGAFFINKGVLRVWTYHNKQQISSSTAISSFDDATLAIHKIKVMDQLVGYYKKHIDPAVPIEEFLDEAASVNMFIDPAKDKVHRDISPELERVEQTGYWAYEIFIEVIQESEHICATARALMNAYNSVRK